MKRVLLLIGVLGCVSYTPPSTYPAPEPVIIPTTPDSVWPAVVDVVTEIKLMVRTIDHTSGFLQTSLMRTWGSEYWDCGQEERSAYARGGSKVVSLANRGLDVFVTISAVPRGSETLLRVSATPDRAWVLCKSKGVWETEFAQKILERWKELR